MIRRFIIPILLMLLAAPIRAQTATSVRVDRPSPDIPTGSVIATIGGQDRKIADNAWQAWVIQGGRAVVYSGTDGAGGFENEGQSLWRYDAASSTKRKLMTEIFMIEKVAQAPTRSGRTALLVTMADGGLGANHVAVVDPLRGEVWRHNVARFLGVRNGRAVVGVYSPHTWGSKSAKPQKMLYLHLDRLLQRRASPMWPVGLKRFETRQSVSLALKDQPDENLKAA